MRAWLFLFPAFTLLLAQDRLPTDSRDWLNQGVRAFKTGRYADATAAFQHAVDLDPNSVNARLYLATSYMQRYIPGATAAENVQIAQQAQDEFERALQLDPANKMALASLASLAYQEGQGAAASERAAKLNEAAGWYEKLLQVDPLNQESLYSLGVIAWAKAYPEIQQARMTLGMRPEDPGPIMNSNLRVDLQNRLSQTIEDGVTSLDRALQINPHSSDTMAYLNLLYRLRADLRDSPAEAQQDIAAADQWVQHALQEKRNSAGTQAGSLPVAAPPPPPPPPPPMQSGTSPQRIRVGANVQAANLIQKVSPVYPAAAAQARIQGTVRFTAIVGKDGQVSNLQLVSGHPLLVSAAQDAARQYLYKPTLLNGSPVEVVTQVDVNFTLNQ